MSIPYRQIHLDFHTSEHIPGIGAAWDKKHWQETLQHGHVNSINIFAVCHHGWSYYNTKVGQRHPHLADGFDLTRAQLDACTETGIHTQVYCTVGVNNRVAREHSEWRCINQQGTYHGWCQRPTEPGFHQLCFNTPYLDFVCDEIREIARLFPDTDGLWLDIIHKPLCYCPWCMESMVKLGLDPKVEAAGPIEAVKLMVELRRRGTKWNIFGITTHEKFELDGGLTHFLEGRMDASFGTTPLAMQSAIKLMGRGLVNPELIVSHRYPLAKIHDAIKTMGQPERNKVIIYQ